MEAPNSSKDSSASKVIRLDREYELRFESDFGQTATIKLLEGTAEFFGTELALQKEYSFSGTKGAIFTYSGCTLEVSGQCHTYTATDTPMLSYLNVHSYLEKKRSESGRGPRVLLVGPTDSGKTSLSKILINYAARAGRKPVFVDLDIGQSSLTVPGMLAALVVDRPIPIGEDFSSVISSAPIVYFYGSVTPSDNVKLYKSQVANMAIDLNKLHEDKEKARDGMVINTCGWVDGVGYELILYAIDSLSADVVLVIDHDRVYSDLSEHYKANPDVKIVKLSKSGGVVARTAMYRRQSRMNRVREYFYGFTGDLSPHSTTIEFRDISIYKVGGGPQAPSSALPIGAESTQNPLRLVETAPSADLLHSVLAVSHAAAPLQLLEANIAGFIYVTEVDVARRKLTIMTPSPGALPSRFALLGSVKWLE